MGSAYVHLLTFSSQERHSMRNCAFQINDIAKQPTHIEKDFFQSCVVLLILNYIWIVRIGTLKYYRKETNRNQTEVCHFFIIVWESNTVVNAFLILKLLLIFQKIHIHVHIVGNCVLSIVIVREGIYLFIDIFLFRNFLRFKYLTLSTSFSSQQTWRTQSARRRRSALINFASYFGIINTINPMIKK